MYREMEDFTHNMKTVEFKYMEDFWVLRGVKKKKGKEKYILMWSVKESKYW